MSDTEKLDSVQDKINKAIEFAKQNAMVVSFVVGAVPVIGGAFYTGITELNKAKDDLAAFHDIVEQFPGVQRKAEAATAKVQEQQEQIIKLQERLSDAYINSREAKVMAEATQREARAAAAASKTEIESSVSSLRTEMNTLKRATSNPLGK